MIDIYKYLMKGYIMHRLIGTLIFFLITGLFVNTTLGNEMEKLVNILEKGGYLNNKEATEVLSQVSDKANVLEGISINGEWYISYQTGRDVTNKKYNQFLLKRGFLLFSTELNSWFSLLITPNISEEASGDIMVRMQHLLGKFLLPDLGFLTKPNFEVGLVHMPWLDYQESINGYRLQDPMFLDRNGTFNGEDLGITFFTLLGGEIDKNHQQRINSKYPGRYGSFSVGLYNGGGFDVTEANRNKVIEGRLTLRPMPDFAPGLCLSYFGVYGKGNKAAGDSVDSVTLPDEPDWTANVAYLSYEHEWFVGAFTYYSGTGNQKGTAINSEGKARDREGYSVFGELRFPHSGFSLMSRYDFFDYSNNNQTPKDESQRYVGGVGYKFFNNNMVFLDYEHVEFDRPSGDAKEDRAQLTLRVNF